MDLMKQLVARRARRVALGALACTVAAMVVTAAPAFAATFSNTTSLTIPDATCAGVPGKASTYPSNIAVSGQVGTVSKVTVSLNSVTSDFQGDLEVLLVSPAGGTHNLTLLSDAGTGTFANATITFDDAAGSTAPQNTAWAPGSYKPTNYTELSGADTFPSPAPSPSANTTLAAAFNGIDPNGTWSLYVIDDACGDGADTIAGGWTLNLTLNAGAPTSTSVTSSVNPSRTGLAVTFTATVTSGGSAVTTGTVTFTEGATTLAANVAVDGTGHAAFSKSNLTEGNHVITATYNGTGSFGPSSGTVDQRVDNNTTVTGTTYCNTGAITVNALPTAIATPYPSNIFVTGAPTVLAKATVTLKNVSHAYPDDIDALLVGPAGQNLEFLSDAGNPGATPPGANNVTVTFDDAAASLLPQNARWASPNATISAKPTNYVELAADTFPSPAPGVSAATTLATFNNTNPNGTWSLYIVSDGAPDVGTIAGGWCLNLTFSPVASISPASVSFGSQTVAVQSNPATVTIMNAGGATLNVASAVITGAEASDFVISSNTCTSPLAATASCAIAVRFTPGAAGDRQAALVVSDNTTTSPHTIPLSGTGVGAGSFNVADATPVLENPTTVSFAVSLSSTPATNVSVSYATQYGDATAGADYTYTEGTLTFSAGASGAALTKTVTVPILEDAVPESDETFFLQLYNPTGATTLGDRFGLAVIQNDDGTAPVVSVGNAAPNPVLENNTTVSFSVTLSASPSAAAAVHYATNYGTATPGADYTYTEGVLTFAAGATGAGLTKTVTVSILEDTSPEPDETFFLQLYDPSGANVGNAFGQAVIQNDDAAVPTLSIANAPDVSEGNTAVQDRKATFAVTLSASPSTAVSVHYATMGPYFDSSATSDVDYVATESVLTFAAGTSTLVQQITIDIVEDTVVEPNESFYVQIYDPTGATLVAGARYGKAVIVNDD